MELQSISVTSKVSYLVGMDLIGLFRPTAMGHQFVLTMTDYFSKQVEAVPLKKICSISSGIYEVYCRQGAPVRIIDDKNTVMRRKTLYTNHCIAIGITIKLASSYIYSYVANQHYSESDHKQLIVNSQLASFCKLELLS